MKILWILTVLIGAPVVTYVESQLVIAVAFFLESVFSKPYRERLDKADSKIQKLEQKREKLKKEQWESGGKL